MERVVSNIKKMFENKDIESVENLFGIATEAQLKQLRELMGSDAYKVIEFYESYQPIDVPMLPCYLSLLDIDSIIEENTYGEPGKYLAKYGVFTFGVTVGGNVVCIDTNNVNNGDPVVLIADSGFCYYDEDEDEVVVALIPDEVEDKFDLSEETILDYESIKLCLKEISHSFVDFLIKLSEGQYDDIESFLE